MLEAPPRYGADIVCGELQPLGIHMHYGGGLAGFVASPDTEQFVSEYPMFLIGLGPTAVEGEYGFGEVVWERTSYVQRGDSKEYTGTTQNLWAIAAGAYLALLGPRGPRGARAGHHRSAPATRPGVWTRCPASARRRCRAPFFKEFVVDFSDTGRTVAEVNAALRERGIFGGLDLSAAVPGARAERARLRHRGAHQSRHRPSRRRARGGAAMTLRPFHQASWNEPILLELSSPGERGIIPPAVERGAGRRRRPARRVSRRRCAARGRRRCPSSASRASCATTCASRRRRWATTSNIHLGLGTCTMKYSPKVNEELVRSPKVADLHPLQDEETVQGMLEVFYRFERMLCEISGLSRFTLQPAGGSQGVYANARMMRAYHAARGDGERDEIITTIFSHPCDGAGPATAGYKVITVYAGEKGYPEPEAIRQAVSERTAGLMITNPEDTGLFNPHIDEIVEIVHDAGGLCHYDQANANGILGITRASDAGFDLCQFNLHKTFSSPHCSMGMPVGACGVTAELAPFLPVPTVEFDGSRYRLDYDRPQSVGKIRAFHGVPATVVRSFAWVLSPRRRGAARGGRDGGPEQQLSRLAPCRRAAASTSRSRTPTPRTGSSRSATAWRGCRRTPA